MSITAAESIAQAFHETYERLAPDHGYETRKASAVPWADVPEQNKSLMIAVVGSLLAEGTIFIKQDAEGWVDGETELGPQIPAVCDHVHYVSYGTPGGEYPSVCRAAVVTEIADCDAHTECVGLAVLNPEGMFFNRHVPHNETSQQREGTWHWPEPAASKS